MRIPIPFLSPADDPCDELEDILLGPNAYLERQEAGREPGTPDGYEKVPVDDGALPLTADGPFDTGEVVGTARKKAAPKYGVNGTLGPVPRITWREVACNNGVPLPKAKRHNAVELGIALNNLRVSLARHYGVKPAAVSIHVNSWYRTPAYNKAIGGEINSRHIEGDAADVNFFVKIRLKKGPNKGRLVSRRVPTARVRAHAEKRPAFRKGGVGAYVSFTHLDTRGYRARWSG